MSKFCPEFTLEFQILPVITMSGYTVINPVMEQIQEITNIFSLFDYCVHLVYILEKNTMHKFIKRRDKIACCRKN